MSDQIVREILVSAKVLFHPHKVSSSKSQRGGVYITAANQLVGTYDNLKSFQRLSKEYSGWEAHHVVEKDDLHLNTGTGSQGTYQYDSPARKSTQMECDSRRIARSLSISLRFDW